MGTDNPNQATSFNGNVLTDDQNDQVLILKNGIASGLFGLNSTGQAVLQTTSGTVDVRYATDRQMTFNSLRDTFQIMQSGSIEIPSVTIDTATGGTVTTSGTISYDPTFGKPIIIATVDQSSRSSVSYTVNSNGDAADDNSIGTLPWVISGSTVLTNLDSVYATTTFGIVEVVKDTSVRLIKADGSYTTANKSSNSTVQSTITGVTYGSSSDLWGEAWSGTDIADPNFGVAISFTGQTSSSVTEYLTIKNLLLSIPTGATVSGIEVVAYSVQTLAVVSVDMIRITVHYTEDLSPTSIPLHWEGVELGAPDISTAYVTHFYEASRVIRLNDDATFTLEAKVTFASASPSSIETVGPWIIRYYVLRETAV